MTHEDKSRWSDLHGEFARAVHSGAAEIEVTIDLVCKVPSCGTVITSPQCAPDGNAYCFRCCPEIYGHIDTTPELEQQDTRIPSDAFRVVNMAECFVHGGREWDNTGLPCPLCVVRAHAPPDIPTRSTP